MIKILLLIAVVTSPVWSDVVDRSSVDAIDGWNCIYRKKTGGICADTEKGDIASVTLSGPVGFEGGTGVRLSSDAVQALASMYEAWILGPTPPDAATRVALENSIRLARRSSSEPAQSSARPVNVKIVLEHAIAKNLFDTFPTDRVSKRQVDIGLGPETVEAREIREGNIRLMISHLEGSGTYQGLIETTQNLYAFDSPSRKVVEASGDAARRIHAALAIAEPAFNDSRTAEVITAPFKAGYRGTDFWNLRGDGNNLLSMRFRLEGEQVYMHLEYTTTADPEVYADNIWTAESPYLMTSAELGEPRKSARHVSAFHFESGRSALPRWDSHPAYLRNVRGELVPIKRDPTGP